MAHVNLPAPGGSRIPSPASQTPRPASEQPAATAPSPRGTAGASAPESLSASASVPQFERRTAPGPEIPGVSAWVDRVNQDPRPPQALLSDLREARAYFAERLEKGEQTVSADGNRTNGIINPILVSENARTPGLNAVGCSDEKKMAGVLRAWSAAGGDSEGHIRFHLGLVMDIHRVAVDAFRHSDGTFTLVAVDSSRQDVTSSRLAALEREHPDVIKGSAIIPTPNQAHVEGCRIFSVSALNGLHDFEPDVRDLHRQIRDKGQGKPAPRLAGAEWNSKGRNTYMLGDINDSFGKLDGKFFKHMQVLKPKDGGTRTLLDEAEDRNPALKTQILNKKDQTLRGRFEGLSPDKRMEDFSRADRTLSLDRKRLALIDRAIAHYEGLARAA